MDYKKLRPHKDKIIIKISAEDREKLFYKNITLPDGSVTKLFVTVDEEEGIDRKSEIYVQSGEIISVGENVRIFKPGDTAILDYLLDNDPNCVLGWEGQDKYVSVTAHTTYYKEDVHVFGNRKIPNSRDTKVAKKGQPWEVSMILGVLRGNDIIANDPYVFLEYRKQGTGKTKSGIHYKDETPYAITTVLSVSKISTETFGIIKGKPVYVKHSDVFDVKLADGGIIIACNDEDVLAQI